MRQIKTLITLGPSSVPLDDVRRITNHSTGSLGSYLVDFFRSQSHEVIAFRGEGATAPCSSPFTSFHTNEDLLRGLQKIAHHFQPDLILHVAALSDYTLDRIEIPEKSASLEKSKISSQHEQLTIHLKPAPKILPLLRSLFPKSLIVGWKYEMEGTPNDAIAKAVKQVSNKHSDWCVINGKAYGVGFGLCNAEGDQKPHLTRETLAQTILDEILKTS